MPPPPPISIGIGIGIPEGSTLGSGGAPAGALQAEDATYLLTEAGDYLEAE